MHKQSSSTHGYKLCFGGMERCVRSPLSCSVVLQTKTSFVIAIDNYLSCVTTGKGMDDVPLRPTGRHQGIHIKVIDICN